MQNTPLDPLKRKLLKSAAGGLVLGPLGIAMTTRAQAGRHLPPGLPAGSAAVIGRVYLEKYPEEASRPALLKLLEKGPGDKTTIFHGHALKTSIENDFRDGDIVFLDGWALSRTEVRLCALALV